MRWGNRDQSKERLLLTPLNEGLLCAAFTDDGIPSRPTHRQPQQIRIKKLHESSQKKKSSRRVWRHGIKRPDNSQKNKRPRRRPQSPAAMPTLPEGSRLESAQITITPSQQQPEQRQWAYCQDAMEPAQGCLNPSIHWDQSQQLQSENPLLSNISCDSGIHERTLSVVGQMPSRWECSPSRCRHWHNNSNRSRELSRISGYSRGL